MKIIDSILRHPACLLLLILSVAVLMVPNFMLCVTESMSVPMAIVNIFMPAGFYLLFLSLFKRTGWGVWALLPFFALAAFQIVILSLYGGSIIAVDMFLNVVTTNMSEATELLENLGAAITTVVVLYLPVLIYATVTIIRGKVLGGQLRRVMRFSGIVLMTIGAVVALGIRLGRPGYRLVRDVFPINVIHNITIAVDRTVSVEHYPESSRGFVYNAECSHGADVDEIYVMVIGETSRAMNWALNGYDRPTNPKLSKRDHLTFFSHALSESNTTHKSVPMLMSHITAVDFDSIGYVKSVITAFKEAGFSTSFISNQAPNHSYTEYFGNEADECVYLTDTLGRHRYDGEMLPYVEKCLKDTCCHKRLIVMHSYGSHFKYGERYPEGFGSFKPDVCADVSVGTRPLLMNAYDNSIEYTDLWLDQLVGMLEDSGKCAAVVYSSDHGEDILDDSRERFLHASPTPTYYQLHVAMLTWVSSAYDGMYPDKLKKMRANKDVRVSSTSSLYNTLLNLSGVSTPYYEPELSVAETSYSPREILYLNDLNVGVDIVNSGLKYQDVDILNGKHFL